jgi:hypothetical protein
MQGYIILNKDGHRLTRYLWWGPGDGYVFSESERDAILAKAATWKSKPASYVPATYDPSTGDISIAGKPTVIFS